MRAGRQPRRPGRVAFGEEQVPERTRLHRQEAFGEQFAFQSRALIERQGQRGGNRLGGHSRRSGAGPMAEFRSRRGGRLTSEPRRFVPHDNLARAARPTSGGAVLRESDGGLEQTPGCDGVDQTGLCRSTGGERLAVGAHPHGQFAADEARQALCPARARDQAEQHFRLAEPGVIRGHTVVTGHGEFETAAERVAVDGGDERLGGVFELIQQRVNARRSLERLLARRDRVKDP